MKCVILMGIQASGKSTFYSEQFRDTHIRLNLDMLKNRNREAKLFQACLSSRTPFVIDNTNPAPENRERYIPEAKAAKFKIIGYYFDPDIEGCISRNAQRDGRKCVPDYVIQATQAKMVLPTFDEGFDELYLVSINEDGEFAVIPFEESIS